MFPHWGHSVTTTPSRLACTPRSVKRTPLEVAVVSVCWYAERTVPWTERPVLTASARSANGVAGQRSGDQLDRLPAWSRARMLKQYSRPVPLVIDTDVAGVCCH